MINIAINGFGRIGRNAFKIAFERRDVKIVAINDVCDTKTLAHLLKHDSSYGTYDREVSFDDNNIIVILFGMVDRSLSYLNGTNICSH